MSENNFFECREATNEDVEVISQFQRSMAMESEGLVLIEEIVTNGVRSAVSGTVGSLYFVAELTNPEPDSSTRVIGCLMITKEWSDWRNGFFFWIQSVFVAPLWRRKGVFRALYEHVRKLCISSHNCVGIRLYAEKDNKNALETYKRLGMDVSGYRVLEWLKGSKLERIAPTPI